MDAAESDPRHTSETLNAVTSAIPIAEGLRSPVSAVADPEAHVRNVVADPSAGTTVPQRDGQVNVEKAGESAQPVQAGEADTTQSGALRETYGLRQQSLTEKQRSVQRELSRWKVSRGASETISRMVPDSITDLDRYTSAASCMYRLGQMEGVKTFDKALELAGSTSGLAGFTNYVLQQPGGKEALQAAWTQGQGETEAAGGLGGALSSQSTSGEGRVIWKGSLRAAKENAAAIEGNGAAKGVRFRLHEGKDSLAEQMNNHLSELEEMDAVADIRGTEVLFGKSRAENITNIVDYFNKLGNKVEREGFGVVELTKNGARATVEHGNSRAKQIAVASVPEVIQKGIKIGFEKNWQNRGYDTHVFAAPVKINGAKLYEGVIVREYIRQNGIKNFYVHEVCWTDGSYVMLDSNGNVTKKEDTPTLLPKAVRGNLADAQEVSSETSIAQDAGESKENSALCSGAAGRPGGKGQRPAAGQQSYRGQGSGTGHAGAVLWVDPGCEGKPGQLGGVGGAVDPHQRQPG